MRFILVLSFLSLISSAAVADRGDIFLNIKGVTTLFYEDFSAGGQAGIGFGINEKTEIQLNAVYLIGPKTSSSDGFFMTRFNVTSFYTPYFGDIMPRIGGFFGFVFLEHDGKDIYELMPMVGVPLQGVVNLSSSLGLVGEVAPAVAFGKESFFDVAVKLGFRFRLSK
ncbi:MAG: hypothetical protein HQK83_19880 [Fibrobacteria bacterium]|nr:hypothetical protein [Fibrobacteria bacterium]